MSRLLSKVSFFIFLVSLFVMATDRDPLAGTQATQLGTRAAMGVWRDYKVLIVMGSSLALIHAGWYQLKAHPHLYKSAARQPAGDAKSE